MVTWRLILDLIANHPCCFCLDVLKASQIQIIQNLLIIFSSNPVFPVSINGFTVPSGRYQETLVPVVTSL